MKSSKALSPADILRTLLHFEFSPIGGPEERSRILKDFATREFNAILWIFLIATIFLLLTKIVSLFSLWSKGKLIPGPPSSFFYGHSKLISRENLNEILSDSHNKYGSVIKLWLGPTQLLVSIKEPEIIKEILLKADDKLPLTGRVFRLAFGQLSLFVSSFLEVKRRRESLTPELSERVLKGVHAHPIKFEDCIIERIPKFITKGSVDCKMISQHISFTLLGYLVFGDAFLEWPKANIYEEFLMMISRDACFWASYRVTPFWKLGFWNYQSLCTKLKSLTEEFVHLCKDKEKNLFFLDQNCYNCNGTSNIRTRIPKCVPSCSNGKKPIDFLMRCLHDHHTTEEELYGNIMGLMFHGSLALSGLISNIIARLAENPEIQYKIYTEIRMAKKVSNDEERQNVNKTPFLLASIYESARLLPNGTLLQRCSLEKDLILKTGITIPAGTVLVVPVQLIHMDDSTWGTDADQFNPYRFLSSSGQSCSMEFKNPRAVDVERYEDSEERTFVLNEPIGSTAFLSFGSGSRACIGQKLAIQGVATLLASLIEKYEIRIVSGSTNDRKPAMSNETLLSIPKVVFVDRTAEDAIKT